MRETTSPRFERFLEKFRRVSLYQDLEQILNWDQQTHLPPGGAERRGEQAALVSTELHSLRTNPEYVDLLKQLANDTLDEAQAAAVRAELREATRALAIPSALVAEFERQKSRGYAVWQQARKNKDASSFLPELERVIEIRKRFGECWKEAGQTPYDGLLSEFEPRVSSAMYTAFFEPLKAELVEIVEKLHADSTPEKPVPVAMQDATNRWVIARMGYDFNRGRLDVAPHPFCSRLGNEIRLTTRYDEADWRKSFYAALHEMGHGFYEFGLLDLISAEPLRKEAGMGMHESQSRFWENQVGRSREFCRFLAKNTPSEYRTAFGTDAEDLFGRVNRVRPNFIRVEADEVTYNLHILLRYELERDILSGALQAKDLPDAWRERFERMFHLAIPSDDLGVLQDIHWSIGLFGYFPTYSLGNLIAAQLGEAISAELDFASLIEAGDFAAIRSWLGRKIHRFGNSKATLELVQSATGKPLSHEPMIRYFKKKFGV